MMRSRGLEQSADQVLAGTDRNVEIFHSDIDQPDRRQARVGSPSAADPRYKRVRPWRTHGVVRVAAHLDGVGVGVPADDRLIKLPRTLRVAHRLVGPGDRCRARPGHGSLLTQPPWRRRIGLDWIGIGSTWLASVNGSWACWRASQRTGGGDRRRRSPGRRVRNRIRPDLSEVGRTRRSEPCCGTARCCRRTSD